ncbi:antibiotic biosynthesis monooxygenase [Cryobacterium algoritolerans]|uniref:Antibiotic biosynthesis monooxygenase n=1 Tax=Cryobacterium algoritolerans TaxID=1259184 RepID=A0A4R8WYP9_9MICO|nr:antibiotic biosynthesis monooxygenase [Cryobacterium algoritolerans]TFC18933.1 antibiotic biosynthesis monooxygenase [Cryobacterium algoritolerans]
MTLTVFLDLQLKPEATAAAPAMLREILAQTRAFAGCLGVDVLLDKENAAHVILLERWASVEADATYREWRAGAGATELGSLLAHAPKISQFETASDI